MVRRMRLFEEIEGQQVPCVALAAAAASLGIPTSKLSQLHVSDGHLNLGSSPEWLSLEKFAAEAVRVALDRLGLPADQRVVTDEPRKKPWWKFW